MEDNEDADEPLAEEPQHQEQPPGRFNFKQTLVVPFLNKEIFLLQLKLRKFWKRNSNSRWLPKLRETRLQLRQ